MRSLIEELLDWLRSKRPPLNSPGGRVSGGIESLLVKLLCLALAALIVRECAIYLDRAGNNAQPMPPSGERAHGTVEN